MSSLYNNLMAFLFAEENKLDTALLSSKERDKKEKSLLSKYDVILCYCRKLYFDDLFKRLDVFLSKDYNCTK